MHHDSHSGWRCRRKVALELLVDSLTISAAEAEHENVTDKWNQWFVFFVPKANQQGYGGPRYGSI